jgi:hypothetical protein
MKPKIRKDKPEEEDRKIKLLKFAETDPNYENSRLLEMIEEIEKLNFK